MKKLSSLVAASGAVCLVGAAMVGARAHAALVTDSYSFDNKASDNGTVDGTFSYDTSAPTVLTDFTMNIGGYSFDSAVDTYTPPVLPTFDGSELEGPFNLSFTNGIIFNLYTDTGTFGPGATGSATEVWAQNGTPLGSVDVSGSITYQLNNAPTSGSSVPLPAGAVSGLATMLAMGGFAARNRRGS